jgi:hypothetical protein
LAPQKAGRAKVWRIEDSDEEAETLLEKSSRMTKRRKRSRSVESKLSLANGHVD